MRPAQIIALGGIGFFIAALLPIFSRNFLAARRHSSSDSDGDHATSSTSDSEELNDGSFGVWPWELQAGGDVCKPGRGQLKRYLHKVDKLQDLSFSIRDASFDRLDRVLQLRARADRFDSCFRLVNGSSDTGSSLGPELQALLNDESRSPESLKVVMAKVSNNLITWAKKRGFLPTQGSCSFSLELLDMKAVLENEDQESEARQQLFGPSCDAAASKKYTNGLDKASKRFVSLTLQFISHGVAMKQKRESAESVSVAVGLLVKEAKEGIAADTPGMRPEYISPETEKNGEHVKQSLKASAALMEMNANEDSQGWLKILLRAILIITLIPMLMVAIFVMMLPGVVIFK